MSEVIIVGNCWEALVKITKKALRSVTYDRPIYEKSFVTFLIKVESTLNSRPLTHVSNDIIDFNVITPNHCLICRANFNSPGLKPDVKNLHNHMAWKSVQALTCFVGDFYENTYQH